MGGLMWLAVAQSPLAYIGIDRVGRFLSYQGTRTDSVFFPSFSVSQVSIVDTLRAAKDTTLFGNPAYILFQISHRDSQATTDTIPVWESGSDVMTFYPLGDFFFPVVYYRTPFSTGSGWAHGFPRAVPIQVDQDATVETLYVVTDTVRVLGMVPVTVPLGTFNAYHLVRTIRMVAVDPDGGFAPDSYAANVSLVEWVVPSVGPVRDSLYTETRFRLFGSWVEVAHAHEVREAVDRGVPVVEGSSMPGLVFRVKDGRFALEGVRPGTQVLVMDALGRVYRAVSATSAVVEGDLPVGKGLYWIRAVAPNGEARTFRALRLR